MWTSPYEAVAVGDELVGNMIEKAAANFSDETALIDGSTGLKVAYRSLAERICEVAAGLARRGFGPGQTLALWAPNMPQWAGVSLGAIAAGGAVTGINPGYTERELVAQLRDSRATLLVTVPSLASTALTAAANSEVREVVTIGDAEGTTPLVEILASEDPAPEVTIDPDKAVALLPYSSGTTGLPKGVKLSHTNVVTNVRQIDRGLRLTQHDTLLAVVPFAHVMGFVVHIATALASGATVVTMPRFDLQSWLELIQRQRVTVLVGVPQMMAALARHPLVDNYDLSSIKLMISGGAPLSSQLQAEVAARIPNTAVCQAWGMTELTLAGTLPDRRGTATGSVGRLAPNTELRVVDIESGKGLGSGKRGELWIRGPQVMAGYLNNPEATANTVDEQGWLRTGDLGYVDENDFVYIVDRLKELIKVSAHQVAPAELEAVLLEHPAVVDAAVFPRKHAELGEVPVAMVVTRGELDPDALIAWVAERVAPYKRIRAVWRVDAIPRTPSGKLMRRALAAREGAIMSS